MELILVLHNIRSTYNVGAILRTADGLGISRVVFSGYTPRMNDERVLPHLREKLNKQINKTALGAEEFVESYAVDDINSELKRLKEEGFTIVGLENNIDVDKPLLKTTLGNADRIKTAVGEKAVLLLGEEVKGIPESLYDIISVFLEIPMMGQKESFNVSVAAGIVSFYLMILNS
jgi:tRNA G18 (ribose-2'-O)-methylase SpoU